jgi:hypothetical protein
VNVLDIALCCVRPFQKRECHGNVIKCITFWGEGPPPFQSRGLLCYNLVSLYALSRCHISYLHALSAARVCPTRDGSHTEGVVLHHLGVVLHHLGVVLHHLSVVLHHSVLCCTTLVFPAVVRCLPVFPLFLSVLVHTWPCCRRCPPLFCVAHARPWMWRIQGHHGAVPTAAGRLACESDIVFDVWRPLC